MHGLRAGNALRGELTRRDFAKTCAGLAARAAADLRFPTRPRDRLAVASYPFRAFFARPGNTESAGGRPGITLKDFAAMVRDRFDVYNIEPMSPHFPSTDPAYLGELRNAVERAGSHIVNIPLIIGASLYDPDPARRDLGIGHSRKWVDVAAAVGAPSIRVPIQRARDTDPDVDRTSESLKSIAEYGAEKGIIINLENDNPVSEDPFFLVKVLDKVNSSYLRALPDFGNSMLSGDEAFNYRAVAAMFRYAYNVAHVKDSEVHRGKLFLVDMERTFAIAKASGYRGYFSMEWEGQGGPYEGTQQLIDASLKHLSTNSPPPSSAKDSRDPRR